MENKKIGDEFFSDFQKDGAMSYFTKLMSGEKDEARQGLTLDFLQMFMVTFYNVFEAFLEDLYKDKDSVYKELIKDFPDYIVKIWLERIKGQIEIDLKEYEKQIGLTEAGKLMEGLFGNMFDIKGQLETYLQKADEVGETFKKALKSGRTIKKDV